MSIFFTKVELTRKLVRIYLIKIIIYMTYLDNIIMHQ